MITLRRFPSRWVLSYCSTWSSPYTTACFPQHRRSPLTGCARVLREAWRINKQIILENGGPSFCGQHLFQIYCGASCPKYLLYRLCLLLAPGGLLVGPVVNSLVRVRKHPRTQALEETRMFSVRFGQLVLPDPEEERAAYESVTAQALADWQGRRSRRQQQEQQGHHQHQPQQQVSGLPRCALCGRGAADACLNPCCHTTACVACAASLAACPACGAPVQRVVHAVCSTPV
eukprot:TRINITY_DN4205_c0_g1_i2.p1 TRINITY_DN4205_c0_g1~~TRINITY_DN4205_c0_g1_i2.p1  ORF type:complete len:231 (-),score=30.41 TRINITY_DN4205_c0_g1_i2:26-718(-)